MYASSWQTSTSHLFFEMDTDVRYKLIKQMQDGRGGTWLKTLRYEKLTVRLTHENCRQSFYGAE